MSVVRTERSLLLLVHRLQIYHCVQLNAVLLSFAIPTYQHCAVKTVWHTALMKSFDVYAVYSCTFNEQTPSFAVQTLFSADGTSSQPIIITISFSHFIHRQICVQLLRTRVPYVASAVWVGLVQQCITP